MKKVSRGVSLYMEIVAVNMARAIRTIKKNEDNYEKESQELT